MVGQDNDALTFLWISKQMPYAFLIENVRVRKSEKEVCLLLIQAIL